MKTVFKLEDFLHCVDRNIDAVNIAQIANKKLTELLEASPTVYCSNVKDECWGNTCNVRDTHSAKLMFIEPIKREQCKHEPKFLSDFHPSFPPCTVYSCKHCGIELIATWSEK